MLNDLRFALRSLKRDRAFMLFSVIALALGLGLNGALLVLSRTFFLRDAPVANPGSLLEVLDGRPGISAGEQHGSTTAYDAVRGLPEFQGVAFTDRGRLRSWNRPEGTEPVQVMEVTHEYLPVVGVRPYLGRGFQPGETGTGSVPPLALVTHRFWKQRLQGRQDVLGSLVSLDGNAHTIVGVLPPGFEGHALHQNVEVFVPAEIQIIQPSSSIRYIGTVLARLRGGATPEQATARLATLPWGSEFALSLRPYRTMPGSLKARLVRGLWCLHTAAFLILGIALANVLALQSARLHHRQQELAVRMALGASGKHLFRLILAESLILSGLAGMAALLLVSISGPLLQSLQSLMPDPPKAHLAFGPWSAVATLLLSLAVGFVLSGLMVIQVRRLDLGGGWKNADARVTGTRVRSLLVATQAALSLVLLCAASLCLRDLRQQLAVPLGMEISDRYLLECHPGEVGRRRDDLKPLVPALRERLKGLPGVLGVAASLGGPIRGAGIMCGDGGQVLPATHDLTALMGIQVLEGRPLESKDESQGRVLISQAYARKLWPGVSPVGRRWYQAGGPGLEVVGVIPDLRFEGPSAEVCPLVVGTPADRGLLQETLDTLTIKVSGASRATKAAIQAAARSELKDVPFTLNSLEEIRDEALQQPRQMVFLSTALGLIALLLSLCGLYGLAAHLGETRKRELGIRQALGAGPGRILGTLARGSLLPVLPGLAAGSALAIALSRLLIHRSDGFPPLSAALLLQSCLLLTGSALIACLIPALRAARVNPSVALRGE